MKSGGGVRLNTTTKIRREMAKVYAECRRGDLATSEGSKLIFMLTSILHAIESNQNEERLEQLERLMTSLRPQPF